LPAQREEAIPFLENLVILLNEDNNLTIFKQTMRDGIYDKIIFPIKHTLISNALVTKSISAKKKSLHPLKQSKDNIKN